MMNKGGKKFGTEEKPPSVLKSSIKIAQPSLTLTKQNSSTVTIKVPQNLLQSIGNKRVRVKPDQSSKKEGNSQKRVKISPSRAVVKE